jgi:hypothetical protein|nr:MAG TPA: hypothetical protein [Caudoviricetes sp.]
MIKDKELLDALVEQDIERVSKILESVPSLEKEDLEENIRETSKKWFKNLEGVKYSDWRSGLLKHTFPYQVLYFRKELVKRALEEDKEAREEMANIIDNLISEDQDYYKPYIENGMFVKLDSRSPKDYMQNYPENSLKPLRNGTEIVNALMCSMRTFEDLCFLVRLDRDFIRLYVKPFEELNRKQEWRVFVRCRKIVGISQQFYEENFNYDDRYLSSVRDNLKKFVEEIVIPNITVENFVVDTIVFKHSRYLQMDYRNEKQKVVLIETNPYYLSDPCLYKSYKVLEDIYEGKIKENDLIRYVK